jgi:hypothetical protein
LRRPASDVRCSVCGPRSLIKLVRKRYGREGVRATMDHYTVMKFRR